MPEQTEVKILSLTMTFYNSDAVGDQKKTLNLIFVLQRDINKTSQRQIHKGSKICEGVL